MFFPISTFFRRYWVWPHNPSSPTTYFHISKVKNRECKLAGIFLLNCVILHMQIFTEIHVAMWHVHWFNRIYRLESILTVKDFVLVMFFKVSLALFILIVSTIIFANCFHGKVDPLIFHLQNFQSGCKQSDTYWQGCTDASLTEILT